MKKYSVVLVENDEDEQLFMREGFAATGRFEILTAVEDGHALFDWLAAHPEALPDLILSDLNMPGKNGYEILADIRQDPSWSAIPVIITSTSTALSVIERCRALGCADYLAKPDTFAGYATFANRLYEMLDKGGKHLC